MTEPIWIGSDHPFDVHEVYLRFRSTLELAQQPSLAELDISADSRYKLWINGRFVARGPARSYPHKQCVDQHDVTAYLYAGSNVIAVQVYQPGYSHFSYVYRGAAGLLFDLRCDGESVLVSGPAWRTRRDPSFSDKVPPASIYIAGVEKHDLNLADNWIDPHYDDSGWAGARNVAALGGYPWTDTQTRSIPLLNERDFPAKLIETRIGQDTAQEDSHLALRDGWSSASEQDLRPDHDGWFSVSLEDGQSAFWLYDLGRGYSCQGWAEVRAARGTESLAISYSEKLAGDDLVISDPATYCRVRMTDTFRLRPGDQVAEPFSIRGGRLILFQVSGPTAADFEIRFHTLVSEYPLEVTRPLTTSDERLNQIITICENTLQACLYDGFVDNPWRESAQWIGDVIVDGMIMASMTEDTRPLRRLLELAVQGVYPDGILPSVLPSEALAYVVVDFNFQWIELLHFYHTITSDDVFVRDVWQPMARMLDRFHQDINASGLLMSQTGRRLFMDWAPISRNEPHAAYNLHYLLGLRRAVDLAECFGKSVDASKWSERADALRAACREAFWEDGIWYDDREHTTFSQLSAAYAVLGGANNPDEIPSQLDAIIVRSMDDEDHENPTSTKMILASPYMHHRIFSALREHDRDEAVLDIIRLRWGRWVDGGFPTTWENWNVNFPDGSQCHGFSAHPRYHMAEIAKKRGGI